MIVSDHGVGPVHYHLHLNNWLIQEGLLDWKNNFSTRLRRLSYRLGLTPTNIYRHIPPKILERMTLGQTRAEFARIERDVHSIDGRNSLVKQWFAALMRFPFLYLEDIDWARSVAYSGETTQNGLIYLNLKGREPQGSVAPGEEYQQVREKIRQRLYAWINPINGEKMVDASVSAKKSTRVSNSNWGQILSYSIKNQITNRAKARSFFLTKSSNRSKMPMPPIARWV